MAKRSITEVEISLIKAMHARGMKNKGIQFHFNRPERAVNSGRITEIANGTYGDSANIKAATDGELERYLRSVKSPVLLDQSIVEMPLSETRIREMFVRDERGIWRLKDGESDTRECKSNFGLKHAYQWTKAIAGLANNRGGYIFFGVSDGSHKSDDGEDLSHAVSGLSSTDFEDVDPVEITSKLKSILDPTPRIERTVVEFDGKRVGVIHVEQHVSRPIIATRADGDKIKEGDIYYRYPGQTARIKYSDLRGLLDDRDRQARSEMLPFMERLVSLGPRRAVLADLDNGELFDGKKTIILADDIVDRINFIREGSFNEVSGAPTLKLVGDVTTSTNSAIGSRGAITDEILLRNFLKQETISQPSEYLLFAAGAGRATWLPMRYFALKGGLSRDATIQLVREANGTTKRKSALIEKLKNDKAAFHTCVGAPALILLALERDEIVEPTSIAEAAYLAQAVYGLDKLQPPTGKALMETLERWLSVLPAGDPKLSYFRRAACRLDELMFPFL